MYQGSGGALFDGIDDNLGTSNSIPLQIASKTIVFSVRPTTTDAGIQAWFGSGPNYYISRTGASSHCSWRNSAGTQLTLTGAASFSAGTKAIYSVRFDVNGSNVDITQRVNGIVAASGSRVDGYDSSYSAVFRVGDVSNPGIPVDSIFYHTIVYSRALSDGEIAKLEAIL